MPISLWPAYADKEDRRKIINAYDSSKNKIEDLSAEKLVLNIEWRLYTEFCLNNHRSNHFNYPEETFTKWVNDETHYEMERQGFHWDGKNFQGMNIIESYSETRDRVLVALTERAIEFFRSCEEYLRPKKNDFRNLRESLKNYISKRTVT